MVRHKYAMFLYLSLFSFVSSNQYDQTFSMENLTIRTTAVLESKNDRDAYDFLQGFIEQNYQRDLVTQFIRVCPKSKQLSGILGKDPSTISKLKNPALY